MGHPIVAVRRAMFFTHRRRRALVSQRVSSVDCCAEDSKVYDLVYSCASRTQSITSFFVASYPIRSCARSQTPRTPRTLAPRGTHITTDEIQMHRRPAGSFITLSLSYDPLRRSESDTARRVPETAIGGRIPISNLAKPP